MVCKDRWVSKGEMPKELRKLFIERARRVRVTGTLVGGIMGPFEDSISCLSYEDEAKQDLAQFRSLLAIFHNKRCASSNLPGRTVNQCCRETSRAYDPCVGFNLVSIAIDELMMDVECRPSIVWRDEFCARRWASSPQTSCSTLFVLWIVIPAELHE